MISAGDVTFANLTNIGGAEAPAFPYGELLWSGSPGWTGPAGNSAPPSPDALDFSFDKTSDVRSFNADYVVVWIAGQIAMQVQGLGGSFPGVTTYQGGVIADQRSLDDGSVVTTDNPSFSSGVSGSSNFADLLSFGIGTGISGTLTSPGGLLINPSPPDYPGRDLSDTTNDVLWTPDQLDALDGYTLHFNGGDIHWMGGSVPASGIPHDHYWRLSIGMFTLTNRFMCWV